MVRYLDVGIRGADLVDRRRLAGRQEPGEENKKKPAQKRFHCIVLNWFASLNAL